MGEEVHRLFTPRASGASTPTYRGAEVSGWHSRLEVVGGSHAGSSFSSYLARSYKASHSRRHFLHSSVQMNLNHHLERWSPTLDSVGSLRPYQAHVVQEVYRPVDRYSQELEYRCSASEDPSSLPLYAMSSVQELCRSPDQYLRGLISLRLLLDCLPNVLFPHDATATYNSADVPLAQDNLGSGFVVSVAVI